MDALVWVPAIRHAHLALVLVSGTLFTLRGIGVLVGARWPMRRALRVGSVVIDTMLLAAGAALWALLSLNPLRGDHWLGAKLLLLVVYIVLGTWALKRACSMAERVLSLAAALGVFATMVSIGWARHPLGVWRHLLG